MRPHLAAGLALLAGCASQAVVPPEPVAVVPDTVLVWVTDAADTLSMPGDSLAHRLGAAALRWQVAETRDASVLVSRGRLPLVANGPFLKALPPGAATAQLLPWGRAYVLVSDSAVPVPSLADSVSAAGVRADLARFAVSIDAVPSSTLPSRPLQCDSTIARARMTRPSIAYLASDEVGREIAERLAALAGMTAAGLAPREFGWALSDGRQAGVVVTLPPASRRTTTTVFCGARVSALIETRATLITRPTP
jgi:hypothetical protein